MGSDVQYSLEDQIPPDVPVRDTLGRVYCNKAHAVAHGMLVADLEIIVFNERHMTLDLYPDTHIPTYIGFCEHCHEII